MEQLKSHLATLGPIDTELEALGTDANQWEFKKGAIFPATTKVQEEREAVESQQKAASAKQRLAEEEAVRGKVVETVSSPTGGGLVYKFEDGSTINSFDLEINPILKLNTEQDVEVVSS